MHTLFNSSVCTHPVTTKRDLEWLTQQVTMEKVLCAWFCGGFKRPSLAFEEKLK